MSKEEKKAAEESKGKAHTIAIPRYPRKRNRAALSK